MQKFPRCWDNITRISYLQRKIILCSISYYELDNSPISDKKYDELSKQLVELQLDKESLKQSQYYYVFYDFDGTTGFDLRGRLTKEDNEYLTHLALIFGKDRVVTQQKEKKHIKKKKGKLF